MDLKDKTNLSWLYDEHRRGTLSIREINDIFKDFGYDAKTRILLLDYMKGKVIEEEEDNDIDFWLGLLEDDVENAYLEEDVGWI